MSKYRGFALTKSAGGYDVTKDGAFRGWTGGDLTDAKSLVDSCIAQEQGTKPPLRIEWRLPDGEWVQWGILPLDITPEQGEVLVARQAEADTEHEWRLVEPEGEAMSDRDHPPADRLLDPVTVTIAVLQWESGDPYDVVLYPLRPYTEGRKPDEWQVRHDGKIIGYVSRYRGSLDRKIGRLRSPGKMRTLWSYKSTWGGRSMFENYSRAACIRSLVSNARWRSNG